MRIPLPEAVGLRLRDKGARVRLNAATFVPARHGAGSDGRALGVVVDWVRLEGS